MPFVKEHVKTQPERGAGIEMDDQAGRFLNVAGVATNRDAVVHLLDVWNNEAKAGGIPGLGRIKYSWRELKDKLYSTELLQMKERFGVLNLKAT